VTTEVNERVPVLRWIVGLVLAVLLGGLGFVAYKQFVSRGQPPAAASTSDPRLDAFLARADERLVVGDLDGAKEQLIKASGVSDKDARIVLGLARVEIVRAELEWWSWLSRQDSEPERASAEEALNQSVKRALEAMDRAVEKAPTDPATTRLQLDRLRLEAMLIYTMARTGKKEASDKSLAQLEVRHRSHPMLDPLRRIVDLENKPRELSDAGVETDPTAADTATAAPGPAREQHFEFDHEPTPPVRVPGELEIPVSPGGQSPPATP
jgi:hypothetical protein